MFLKGSSSPGASYSRGVGGGSWSFPALLCRSNRCFPGRWGAVPVPAGLPGAAQGGRAPPSSGAAAGPSSAAVRGAENARLSPWFCLRGCEVVWAPADRAVLGLLLEFSASLVPGEADNGGTSDAHPSFV